MSLQVRFPPTFVVPLLVAACVEFGMAGLQAQDPFDPFQPGNNRPLRTNIQQKVDEAAKKRDADEKAAYAKQQFEEQLAREKQTLLDFEDQLRLPISGEFDLVPLKDVVAYISEVTHIGIMLDVRVLQELEIDSDVEVTFTIGKKPIPAWQALNSALQKAHPKLVGVVKNEMIIVTTEEHSYVTTVYDVRDILDRAVAESKKTNPAGRERSELAAGLLKHVTAVVAPESWKAKGGRGRAQLYRDLLVVENSARVHWQIRQDLADVRSRQGAKDPVADEPVLEVGGESEYDKQLLAQMDQDADGYVQRGESPEQIRASFDEFDRDKDGKWSAKELGKAYIITQQRMLKKLRKQRESQP